MLSKEDFHKIWKSFHDFHRNIYDSDENWEYMLKEHYKTKLLHTLDLFLQTGCSCKSDARQYICNLLNVNDCHEDDKIKNQFIRLKDTKFFYYFLHNLVNFKLNKSIFSYRHGS